MKEVNDDVSSQLKLYTFVFNRLIHDFNNILTVLMGYIDLLEEDLIEIGRSDRKINEIKIASNRAMHLIRQIMIFKDQIENNTDMSKMSYQDLIDSWTKFKQEN